MFGVFVSKEILFLKKIETKTHPQMEQNCQTHGTLGRGKTSMTGAISGVTSVEGGSCALSVVARPPASPLRDPGPATRTRVLRQFLWELKAGDS